MPVIQQQYEVIIFIKALGEEDKKLPHTISASSFQDAERQAAGLAAQYLESNDFEYTQCNVDLRLHSSSSSLEILKANKGSPRNSPKYPSLDS